jgi:hypothetical protein
MLDAVGLRQPARKSARNRTLELLLTGVLTLVLGRESGARSCSRYVCTDPALTGDIVPKLVVFHGP